MSLDYNEYLTNGLTISGRLADDMLDKWFGTRSTGTRDLAFDAAAVPIGGAYRTDEWAVGFAGSNPHLKIPAQSVPEF